MAHNSKTRPGVRPNQKKRQIPGTGRGKPAKGYNPETKEWDRK
jgi:hypothetical protein